MTRFPRVEYAGAHYHVINRGNAGEDIFRNIRDHRKFLEYLEKTAERFSIIIHSYCLMPNHYHLLLETTHPNLSRAIQWLNVSYATYFNKKQKRSGHLFQGRFKAILIDADEYLTHLSRYIHLNPVKARLVKFPEAFLWSSYRFFIGSEDTPDWLETDKLLSFFGEEKKKALISYRRFVESCHDNSSDDLMMNIRGGCLLGGESFVQWVTDTYLSRPNNVAKMSRRKKNGLIIPVEDIVQLVCHECGCCQEMLCKKGLKDNTLRDITIYLARDMSGVKCSDLGDYFGGISGAAITARYNKIADAIMNNASLKRKIDSIRRQIADIQCVVQ